MHPELLEPFARTIVMALGVGIIVSAALALLVLAMTRLKPRPSATTRHVLWWLTLAASAILPVVSVASSLGRVEHVRTASAFSADGATSLKMYQIDAGPPKSGPKASYYYAVDEQPATTRLKAQPSKPGALDALAPIVATLQRSLPSAETLRYLGLGLFALWLLVAAAGLASLTRSLVVLRRIKLAASPLDESVTRRLRRWRHSSRHGRAVALCVSNEVDVPVAVGFRLPTILLPAQVVETEDIADIDQIAMHEYAHLDRYDDWTNLLQRLIERIFWFNPVIAFVGRRISLEREIACDDWVVSQTGRAHRYATCLWKLVESSRLPAKPILAPGALLTPKQITVRIEQLLDARRNALPRLSPLGALAVGALCIGLIVVQVQRAPVIAITEIAPPQAVAEVKAPTAEARVGVAHSATVHAHLVAPIHVVRQLHIERVKQWAEFVAVETRKPQLVRPQRVQQSADDRAGALTARSHAPTERVKPEPITIAVVAPESAAALERRVRDAPFEVIAKSRAAAQLHAYLDESFAAAFKNEATLLGTSVHARVLTLEGGHRIAFNPPAPPAVPGRLSLEHCIGCDLSHANLRGLNLSHISLTGANLRGADLRDANLIGAHLIGVDLREAKLDGADLRNATITASDLSASSFRNVRTDGMRISGTIFNGMLAEGTRLRSMIDNCQGCDLHLLDLRGQDLRGVRLTGVDLHGADLRNVGLSEVVFQNVDLHDAHLAGADLRNAKLIGCNLRGIELGGANLSGLSMEGSEIGGKTFVHYGYSLRAFKPSTVQQRRAAAAAAEPQTDVETKVEAIVEESTEATANAPSRGAPPVSNPSPNQLD
jgi:uncharacterized protein YjbI with pentapeptide repeats/beta-lactamase regulating signal transducer with metallopeptidase domain